MSLEKEENLDSPQREPGIRIEISPEPSTLERAVIEVAARHHLDKSENQPASVKSRFGAVRLRDFER
jgi:hypothetical protein